MQAFDYMSKEKEKEERINIIKMKKYMNSYVKTELKVINLIAFMALELDVYATVLTMLHISLWWDKITLCNVNVNVNE